MPQNQTKKTLPPSGQTLIARGMPDLRFMLYTLALVAYGLVMVFSSTYYTRAANGDAKGAGYEDFKSQMIFTVAGLIIMYICSRIGSALYLKLAPYAAAVGFLLLVVVLFYHTDDDGYFKRWIPLPGNATLQPSEIAKVALILFICWYFFKYGKRNIFKLPRHTFAGETVKFGLPLLVVGLYCFLVFREHHLSATILMLVIGMSVMLINGANSKFWTLCAAFILLAVVVVYLKPEILDEYQQQRIAGWKDYALPDGRNLEQIDFSFFAIASGGLFGKGIGHSVLKCGFLSEAHNDFIFAVICEEAGLFGAVVLILLIALLVWRAFIIAKSSRNRFEFGLVGGIALHIALQSAMHIAVVTGTLPNTGIGLPFVSAGGSSIVFLLAEAGIVLSVSRTMRINTAIREKNANGD